MVIGNPFEQAIRLTGSLYNFAALHVIAEEKNGVWMNRYTSVIYGREEDLGSVPPIPGSKVEKECGNTFLCLRQRLARKDAEDFVNRAVKGSADIGAYSVVYDVEPAITGFRPAHTTDNLAEGSMWNGSGWSREHIGKQKEAGGHTFSPATAWRIEECLGFLRKVIWLPIPLREHPEKLGDLDEFWPTPIEFEIGRADGASTVEIAYDILKPEDDQVAISGALIQNDLIYGHVSFSGRGPHRLPIEPEAIDLTLCVGGVPFDAKANRFILRASLGFTVHAGPYTPYVVPEAGARPEMTYQVGTTEMKQQFVGKPAESARQAAWIAGRIFRNRQRPEDAERFYDPVAMPGSVKRAFDDLQGLGTYERRPRVIVADPYALDERALYAIGTIAARLGGVASIDIVTEFLWGDSDPSATEGTESVSKKKPYQSAEEARATKREETQRKAFETADRVAGLLKVRFRFYRAERLHDRFLVIGERLWHVGPSFNKIGEEISALVEMTDEKVKSKVLESLERFMSEPTLKEAHP